MEQFLTTFSQHITSLLNLKAMKWIDTGDRMMDTTIQMIFSTLTAGLVTLILAMYKNKALLQDFVLRVKVFLRRAEPNPLVFNPLFADGRPKNGKAFVFQLDLVFSAMKNAFIKWFATHHFHKYSFIEAQENSMMMAMLEDQPKGLEKVHKNLSWKINKDINIPIWKDKNGYWVYLNTEGNPLHQTTFLRSDSFEALENCFASILTMFNKNLEDIMKAPTRDLLIFETTSKGEMINGSALSKNKIFDSLFFEQKETVLPILQLFKENKLYPSHIPIDNKLGILLHGPPGTGKTAFLSALANFLQRNIILVDMKKLKTQSALNHLLGNVINKNYVFVFEEFDCMPCIQKRESGEATHRFQEQKMSPEMMMMMAMNNKDSKATEDIKKEMDEQKDLIDLGFLLRKLDGIESADGRIIVATTNHPENIDPALLRPGRFGIQINLKKANHKVLRGILEMIYKIPVSQEDVDDIDEYIWSPAEILQNSLMHASIKDYLRFLRHSKPMESF